jgi:hypothetical protein
VGHDAWLDSLRRAAGSRDALVRLLGDGLPDDALQDIGDAILAVPEPVGPELVAVVERLIDRLHMRSWDGDDELADALECVVSGTPAVRTLRVELADIGEALRQSDATENYLDLREGTVWFHTMTDFGVDEDLGVDLSDESRWLFLPGEGSHEAYRDLQRFIATIEDRPLAQRLTEAIDSRGAFGRFRVVLEASDPVEYTRWHRFDADARLGHARSWLADRGYQARPLRHL